MTDRVEAEAAKDKVSGSQNLLQEFEIGQAGLSQLKQVAAENYMKVELELPQISMYDSGDSSKFVAKPAEKQSEEVKATKELAEHGKVSEHTPASADVPYAITKYEDGTVRQEFSTGDTVENRPDGTYIHMKPDHNITVIKDGESTTVGANPDREFRTAKVDDGGNITIDYKDGAQEFYGSDGSYGITYPDKSGYWVEPDGGYTVFHANNDNKSYNANGEQISEWTHDETGSRIHYPKNRQVDSVIAPDGNTRRDFLYGPDGELNEFDGHLGKWKKETQNGKDVWVNQDTKDVWDGKFKVDDKGNLHYTPNNGGPAYIFTPDGRDIVKK